MVRMVSSKEISGDDVRDVLGGVCVQGFAKDEGGDGCGLELITGKGSRHVTHRFVGICCLPCGPRYARQKLKSSSTFGFQVQALSRSPV